MTRKRFGLLAVALAGGLAAAAPQAAPSPPAGDSAARLVVTPRPGQAVRTHPLRTAVRAYDRLGDLRVRLNGRSVTTEFGPRRRGLRRATLGASHALRHGRNVLRVSARQPDGRWRRATVRFRVVHRRPLAGAGRDRRVAIGSRVRLSGLSSRRGRSRKSRVAGARSLRYRWRVVRAPRRSRLRGLSARGATARRGRLRLAGARSARPSFTPDVPGTYELALRVSDPSGATTDRVAVQATEPGWLVPVDTMSGDANNPAIRVGGTAAPASGTPSGCYLQVLVLERATLGFVDNRTFGDNSTCSGAATQDGPTAVANYLKGFATDKLVIAVSHRGYKAPRNLKAALARIGIPQGDFAMGTTHVVNGQPDPSRGGQISVIGVPGMPSGEADAKAVYDDTGKPGDGEMVGYLTPDQYNNYGWLPRERVDFDTRAGSPPGAAGPGNVMQVGTQSYSQSLPAGIQAGFHVVVLDRYTAVARANRAFAVAGNRSVADNTAALRDMAAVLRSARIDDLVLVSSLGAPGAQFESWQLAPALSDVGGAIASLGGTRHGFNEALWHHAAYSLAGWGSAGETRGEETTPAVVAGETDGRLRGTLVPSSVSTFRPEHSSPFRMPNDALLNKLVEPPSTRWPLDNDPGARAALAYLGGLDSRLGPNPRTAYVNDNDWDALSAKIRAAEYPGPDPSQPDRLWCPKVPKGSRCDDFERAKAQLLTEMDWVVQVRKYLANLSSPFDTTYFTSWAKLGAIGTKVQNAANVKPNETATSTALTIIGAVLDVVGIVLPEEKVGAALVKTVEVIAVAYSTGVEFWNQSREGGSDNEVTTAASQLGVVFAQRFEATKAAFKNMGNVIVTDPAKLAFVGKIGGCNPAGNPSCPSEWAWQDTARAPAAAAMSRGAESEFYEKLLPLAFPAYRLDPPPHDTEDEDNDTIAYPGLPSIDKFYCGDFGRNYPFKGSDAHGWVGLFDGRYTSGQPNGFAPYAVYVLGAKEGVDASHPSPGKPPVDALARMFSPLDPGNNPDVGGLAIEPVEFMLNAEVRAYGPHDPFGSNCGWEP